MTVAEFLVAVTFVIAGLAGVRLEAAGSCLVPLSHFFSQRFSLLVFFLLIYILQQIYMVCKKENNAPPRGGAFVRYKLVKMGFLSNWLLEFVFLTYELPLFVSFHRSIPKFV